MISEVLTNPGLIWFLAGVVLLITELFVPTLVLIFFGFGAWTVTAIYLCFEISFVVQLAFFLNSSLLYLIILRSRLKPVFRGFSSSRQNSGKNLDDFLGKEALSVNPIKPGEPGKVEFNGVLWEAHSEEQIEANKRVRITGRSGLSLNVESL